MQNCTIGARWALPGAAAALCLLSACGGKTAPAQQAAAVPVTVVTLAPRSVTLTRELPGRLSAFLVAEVRPQVTGIVARRLFTEGDAVEAGQPLYQLDDRSYRANYASAQASLARAEAALGTASSNRRRSAEMAAINAVSKQDDERAAAALEEAEADVAVARAALQEAAVTLGYARIVAPIAGRIGKSSVTQGALVTANQEAALATVQQLDPIYLDMVQSSAELLALRKLRGAAAEPEADGLPVTVVLEDGSRYAHEGRLAFADVSVDPTTGSYALRAVVPNPEHLLMPGMYVRALLGAVTRPDALLVPQQGIARDAGGNTTAMVVDGDGKAAQRKVVVSQTVGDQWLVESGLAAGDRVIVAGLQKIRPGVPVQATEGAAAADGADAAR